MQCQGDHALLAVVALRRRNAVGKGCIGMHACMHALREAAVP